jgi:hypothetical protein
MAGYSGKSLAEKLGLKSGLKLWRSGEPDNYGALIGSLSATDDPGEADILHLFAANCATLRRRGPPLAQLARPGAMIWISWPKKTSTLFVDLTEGGVRQVMLPTGWVDVKVCAVDDDCSGLKFLRRRA